MIHKKANVHVRTRTRHAPRRLRKLLNAHDDLQSLGKEGVINSMLRPVSTIFIQRSIRFWVVVYLWSVENQSIIQLALIVFKKP